MALKLARLRNQAFKLQSGLCYYCHQPMWQENPESFAQKQGVTLAQARQLQCTAEHLVPKEDGGGPNQKNIVAACRFCNSRRHKRPNAPLRARTIACEVGQAQSVGVRELTPTYGSWAGQMGFTT